MSPRPLRVLQVNTHDARGGAARVAMGLHLAYRALGITAWMAVGRRHTDTPGIFQMSDDASKSPYASLLSGFSERLKRVSGKVRGAWRLSEIFRMAAEPRRWWDVSRGREDYFYPATWRLPELSAESPDIVHCHNLHGNYFDLQALPALSRPRPLAITLHDSWLLGGHCAHPLSCDRWITGCGECPDLSIYPPVRKDATAFNWQRKRGIYSRGHFFVATPSRWLMDKVDRSILKPAVLGSRVIPNGVDLSIFRPGDGAESRKTLGLPHDSRILLFAADWLDRNVFKDFEVIREAVARIATRGSDVPVLFLAMGGREGTVTAGSAEIRLLPYESDQKKVAMYYRSADIYLHAAKAETFGLTIVEALACGTPVVATGVGGIPEIVRSLSPWGISTGTPSADPTGILVPPGDGEAMSKAIDRLLRDDGLRRKLGENAASDTRTRFDLVRQAETYLEWYEDILGAFRRPEE